MQAAFPGMLRHPKPKINRSVRMRLKVGRRLLIPINPADASNDRPRLAGHLQGVSTMWSAINRNCDVVLQAGDDVSAVKPPQLNLAADRHRRNAETGVCSLFSNWFAHPCPEPATSLDETCVDALVAAPACKRHVLDFAHGHRYRVGPAADVALFVRRPMRCGMRGRNSEHNHASIAICGNALDE